jgi:hypothetical protein
MTKKLMPQIDSKNLSDTVTFMVDKFRFRKYADKDYVTVIWINSANTVIKLLDGKMEGLNLSIPCIGAEKLINKVYILPTKKQVVLGIAIGTILGFILNILLVGLL